MIFLILSILCSTAIVLIFKSLGVFNIQIFPTICINYLACVLTAWLSQGSFPFSMEMVGEAWFPYALFLGFIFITGFNITAMTVGYFSVTIAAVMQKMSLVLTVLYTILAFQEEITLLKILGIVLALTAILLINWPEKEAGGLKTKQWYLYLFPLYTLLSSALVDILLFKVERMTGNGANLGFVALIFGIAGLLGNVVLIGGLLIGKIRFSYKEIAVGTVLGVVNFGSIYFLMETIGQKWDGSVVFPINNVSIIVLSSLLALWIFKEKFSRINTIGLACALIAIGLIAIT